MNQRINSKFHNNLSKQLSRKANQKCFFPECPKRAINSHAISKQSSLDNIAVNGKLFRPLSLRNDSAEFKDIVFKEIGINKATTFKGFCQNHDSIFNTIDKNGIKTIRDIFLQIYRSLSKEYFEYKIYKESEVMAFKKELFFDSKHDEQKLVNTSSLLALFYDLLLDVPEAEKQISNYSGNTVTLKPYSKDFNLDITVIYKTIKFKCPVAIHNKLQLFKNNHYYDSFVFLLPYCEKSDLIIISHNDDVNHILSKLSNDIKTLNFIESIMMLDSEWWLSPKIVCGWSNQKKEFIEKDYRYFTERAFLEEYDVSIFDSTRFQLCKKLDKKLQEQELNKISYLPNRSSCENREKTLQVKIIDDLTKIKLHN